MTEQERCKQCNKLLYIEWTMTFKQGSPHAVRWEPAHPQEQFCPGHSMMADTEGWDKLSNEQKYAVDRLRQDEHDFLLARAERFRLEHPEIRLSWSITIDAMLRSDVKEPTDLPCMNARGFQKGTL